MAQDVHLDQTWAHIQTRLRTSFPESTYQIWLAGLEPLGRDDSALYVRVAADARDWVSRRFGATLNRAAAEADHSILRVELLTTLEEPAAPLQTGAGARQRAPRAMLKPTYSFDRFVIGTSNRFAHGAALTIAENPGRAYNPLFIHGPSGVGKTHLLQAVGNYVTLHDPALSVRYTTVEAFTNEFMKALRNDQVGALKDLYRQSDVLLLDDLEFLEGKPKTAEELFHTVDALLAVGAQVVMSGDRDPAQIAVTSARFNDHLQAGLTVDLAEPEHETRLTVLKKLASSSRIPVPDDVAAFLAERVTTSMRAVEGALTRVIAFASLTDSPITVELVEHVLSSLYDKTAGRPLAGEGSAIKQIQGTTASALGIGAADLCSRKRNRRVVYARQVSMYLCRELTSLSLPTIACEFGGRDHTTVLHAHRRVKSQLINDPELRSLITTLTQAIHNPTMNS